jgi:hypothetical protein
MIDMLIKSSLIIFAVLVSGCEESSSHDWDLVGYWRVDSKAMVKVVDGKHTTHRSDGSTIEQVNTHDEAKWTVNQYSFGKYGKVVRISWTLRTGETPPRSLGDLPHPGGGAEMLGSWSLDGDILTVAMSNRDEGLVERFRIVNRSPHRLMTLYTDQQGSRESGLVWRRDMHPDLPNWYTPRAGGESRDPNWTQGAYDEWVGKQKEARNNKSD